MFILLLKIGKDFHVFMCVYKCQEFNASSDGSSYVRKERGAPQGLECGGCSAGCSPKCVAEKGSRVIITST